MLQKSDLKISREYAQSPDIFNEVYTQKGVFPYEYLDSWEKLEETQLPPIESFNSKLTMEVCSSEDYARAQKAWELLKCETLDDYLLNYLKIDVVLLADVFEQFRDVCMTESAAQVDPAYYYSVPGVSWQNALRSDNAKLEILTDLDWYTMCERGVRGGLCVVSKR